MEEIINKVAQSGLITIDLEKYLPNANDVVGFDLRGHLFMELILKEKDFREKLKTIDWEQYTGKHVAVFCSTDAIIPLWAYMLVTSYLQPVASSVIFGSIEEVSNDILLRNLNAMNINELQGARVVIKGCGDKQIPAAAYVEISRMLRPVVQSMMYGEACSTVPVYKAKKI